MLSEEEKKAIEIVKSWISCFENQEDETPKIHKTVLNLITKLQKENEKYKYLYQKALDNTVCADRENMLLKEEKETLIAIVNKQSLDISNNLIELQQKDRQINLMAKAFEQDDVRTVEEIKQYFETKAKKE